MSDANKAVFLSYASQDAEAAKRIADALRSSGVEVWFDTDGGLEHGDEWDRKIRRQIKECVLFLPIISANTQAREEGYFRLEWDMAAERARNIASGVAFILPVVVDGTREPDALVPDRFRTVQWTKLPDGVVPPDVLQRFLKLWSHRTGALQHETERANAPTAVEAIGKPGGKSYALVAVAMALLVAGLAWWMLRPAASGPAASSPAKLSEARQLEAQARALIDDDLMAVRENYRLADEFSRRAVALDGTDGEIWATAARVSGLILQAKYEMTPERKELAKTQVERANRLAPASIETGLAQAIYLGVNGDVPQAERLLRQLIQRAPADKRLWRQLGTMLFADERFDDAQALFRQAAGLLDGDPRSEVLRAGLFIRLGRYREAEAVLGQVLRQSPTKTAYSWQLVLLGFYRCDLPAASKFLEQIPPQLMLEDAMINLAAELWLRLGEGDKALKVLQKSPRDFLEEGFEIRPKGFVVGYALQVAGRPTAAQAEWRQALMVMEKRLAGNPNQPLLLFWQGILQALTGQKALALETRKLYRELETKPDPWFDAMLLVAAGENEQAILGLVAAWPKANFNLRSDIRGDLMYAPWLAAIRPDPRIQAMIAEHTAAIERDRAGPATAPKAEDKSIAVLPFANMSPDKDNEYFADGVHEDVITNLAKVRGLKVISRTSVLAYRDPAARSLRKIAAELGVATVLEGSVRRAGNKVRLTAQLIDARTDQHLWAETYDRDVTDVFAIQSALATEIAAALRTTLSAGERSLIDRRPTDNQEAYDLYLRARARTLDSARLVDPNRTNMTLDEAVTLYEQAVTKDPNFALAYAALSALHSQAYWDGTQDPTPARRERARVAAETAVRLAPDLPQARLALGIYYYRGLRDWSRALAEFRAAEAGLPNDSAVIQYLAFVYRRLGRWTEAVDCFARAAVLNPGGPASPSFQIGTALYLRRFAEANEVAGQVAVRFPHLRFGHHDGSKAQYEIDGDRAAFLRRLEALPRESGDPHGLRAAIELAVARGDYEAADRALADPRLPFIESEDAVIADPVTLYRAQLAFIRGQTERARGFADEAIAYYRKGTWMPRQESWVLRGIAQANAFAGRADEALRDARAALAAEEGHDALNALYLRSDLGRIYAVLDHREEALAVLRTLMTGPSSKTPQEIRHDPLWSRLKDDPRFEEILKSAKSL